jgi:alkylation response protein AidB-like acyl-CoA dehydrogenase
MNFTFSPDQLLFQASARDFLRKEVTPERIRGLWETATGRDAALWEQLCELGLVGMTAPEEFGGLGLTPVDFVLIGEECGYVALPEPLVHTALVAVPTLVELGGDLASRWLPRIAAGTAKVIVGIEQNLLVEDAHLADLLLLFSEESVYALAPGDYTLRQNASVDPSRRLYAVTIDRDVKPLLAGGDAAALLGPALNRGALGCAAQALGLARRMVDMSVQYTGERQQFGKAIGSFQAVKHLLADVAVRLEYARAPVHRAAYSLAHGAAGAALAVSHAKLVACEAASLAAKNSIQVHGAMGYTWEMDLHIYMKKAWALANTWGDAGFHKARVAGHVFGAGARLGAGATFAQS